MKLFNNFSLKSLIACMLVLLITINVSNADPQKWCWTKSQVNNPGFILDNSKGGFNWGYCVTPDKAKKMTVSYSGFVQTALSPGAITESEILIKLCGTKGCFAKYKSITTTGFDKQGIRQEIPDFEDVDVGDPQRLKIKLNGTTGWSCNNIFLIKDGVETNFECLRRLEPCDVSEDLCQLESVADGTINYLVSIKTGDNKDDGNKGPVQMILYGDKRISMTKIFSDKPQKYGQILSSNIQTEELGTIVGFKLILLGQGKWRPTSVSIVTEKTGEEKIFNLNNIVLRYPGDNTYEIKDKVEGSGNNDDPDESTDDENFPSPSGPQGGGPKVPGNSGKPQKQSLNVNNPDGGLIVYDEKKKIVNLKCNQILENTNIPIFGPDYPTKRIEYMSVLARCPANCYDLNATVYGVGIHPKKSPICLSAIVDKAMSLYGGIIQISILPGLDSYKLPQNCPKKLGNITIKSYDSGDSMKSYSLSKVDNVDLVEKDIRILSWDGTLSNYGRLEIRLAGEWGTICNMGNNAHSATVVCKDLGYKGGNWESTDKSPTFCENVKGKSYCGASQSKVHFSNVDCSFNDYTFDKCNKYYADRQKCDHSKDSVIHCYNENYENAKQIPNKTVRLDATKNLKETNEIIGRLELYSIDKFKPVCSLKFNKASAAVACRTMGYDSGEWIDGDEATPFQNSKDADIGFSASEVECEENSPRIGACKGIYDGITCTHDMDTVIKCKGEEGDPTGNSQFEIKPQSPPPELSKLGLASMDVTCQKKGNDLDTRGDPGSIFKICCPAGCNKEPGSIWGTGMYSGDSNICLAALHIGVINQKEPGCFVFTRSLGNSSYTQFRLESITSMRSEIKWLTAFTLSSINSGWENMNKKWKKDDELASSKSSFLETSVVPDNYFTSPVENEFVTEWNKEDTVMGFKRFPESIQYSSFMETQLMMPKPIFSFVETNPKHIFSKNDNYIFEGGKMTKVNDFTVFFKFEMYEFNGPSTLFSFKGPDGFNIFINMNDELYLGSMIDTKFEKPLGMIVPLKSKCSVFAVQKQGNLSFSIIIKNGAKTSQSNIAASFDIPIEGKVGIGRQASENNYTFTGKIDFIEIYPQALSVDNIPDLLKEIRERKNGNKLKKEYTVDSRECASTCMSTPPQTGNPPPEAELTNTNSAEISGNGGLINFNDKEENPENVPVNPDIKDDEPIDHPSPGGVVSPDNYTPPPSVDDTKLIANTIAGTNNLEPILVDEDTTLEDGKFNILAKPKVFFRVECPKMDAKTYYPIFGYAVYRANSSICRAAMHFGKLKPGEKKDIIIRVGGIQQAYNGGMGQYEIQSEDILETEKKLSFTIEEANRLKKLSCEDDLRSPKFLNAALSEIFVVECPKDCANINKEIFGGNTSEEKCSQANENSASTCVYSEDSSICKAGVHCGVVNNMGGFVEVKIEGEQAKFISTNSFGIESKEKPSQVRSFSFVGERSAIYASFKETFEGGILNNWSLHNTPGCQNEDKNAWSFYENNINFFDFDGKKEDIKAVKHTGTITTNLPFTAASYIKKRDIEFANGMVKFNIMIYEIEPIYVFLRFVDDQNFIALLINNKNNMNNYTLFTKVQGSIKVLDTKNMPMELRRWYRYRAYLYSDSIKVTVQEDKVRGHKEIFNSKSSSITRGTIGFGTNGNSNFFVTGITIEPFTPNHTELNDMTKKYSWDHLIKKNSIRGAVKNWCKKTFKYSQDDYMRCQLPQFYCRYKCQELVNPEVYGVLYYNCYTDCAANLNRSMNPGKVSVAEKKEKSYSNNDKVDFLPKGTTSYLAATVIKTTNIDGNKMATVEWEDELGNKVSDEVVFDDERIEKCGGKLKKRTDCVSQK